MVTLWRNAHVASCDEQSRIYSPGAVLTDGDRIAWVGAADELPAGARPERTVELAGRWLTPALVDCHTHLVFAGQRAAEFAQRTSGRSYSDIARAGGGIVSTVRATRAASETDLVDRARPRLAALCTEGVTCVEIKSGYGLTLDGEARMLRAARRLASEPRAAEYPAPSRISTSFLGAHALPPEYVGRADDYIDAVAREWLPALAREGLVDAVDAWCEDIAFTAEQCERVFAAAARLRLPVRLHAEQLSNVGGSRMAARYGALSCDHLEYTTDEDVAALAAAGTVAVMLPIAFYALAETQHPPIDSFRSRGVPMAVASDCNPGSAPGASLLLAMNMARRLFGLTSEEVLLGTTRNAALALALDGERGSLTPGRKADFAVWSIDTLDELGYWTGFNPCSMVVRAGEIALERPVCAAPGWRSAEKGVDQDVVDDLGGDLDQQHPAVDDDALVAVTDRREAATEVGGQRLSGDPRRQRLATREVPRDPRGQRALLLLAGLLVACALVRVRVVVADDLDLGAARYTRVSVLQARGRASSRLPPTGRLARTPHPQAWTPHALRGPGNGLRRDPRTRRLCRPRDPRGAEAACRLGPHAGARHRPGA